MPETFRASFDITPADFAALQKSYAARSVLTKYLPLWILLGLALFAWFSTPPDKPPLLVIAGYGGVWLILVLMVFPLQRYWQFIRMKHEFATGIEASQEKLKCSGPAFETSYTWDEINRVTEDQNVIFVWITSDAAMVIPKRGFSEPAEAERFFAFVKQKASHAS